jgi:hypothetical protein
MRHTILKLVLCGAIALALGATGVLVGRPMYWALAAGGGAAPVATAQVNDEPGYQLMSNPAWQSDELTRVTLEWLDALA